jgi:hypothetical protein
MVDDGAGRFPAHVAAPAPSGHLAQTPIGDPDDDEWGDGDQDDDEDVEEDDDEEPMQLAPRGQRAGSPLSANAGTGLS